MVNGSGTVAIPYNYGSMSCLCHLFLGLQMPAALGQWGQSALPPTLGKLKAIFVTIFSGVVHYHDKDLHIICQNSHNCRAHWIKFTP